MKDLLIYLHGFGFDQSENKEQIDLLCSLLNVDKLFLNASFKSGRARGGYAWFPITPVERKKILKENFVFSLKYIKEKIEENLVTRGQTWKNIILCGRSQGGMMALYVGLEKNVSCKKIITFCSTFPKTKYFKCRSKPSIIWMEEGKESPFRKVEKNSYKDLKEMSLNVSYFKDEKSTHDEISQEAIEKIVKIYKEI